MIFMLGISSCVESSSDNDKIDQSKTLEYIEQYCFFSLDLDRSDKSHEASQSRLKILKIIWAKYESGDLCLPKTLSACIMRESSHVNARCSGSY